MHYHIAITSESHSKCFFLYKLKIIILTFLSLLKRFVSPDYIYLIIDQKHYLFNAGNIFINPHFFVGLFTNYNQNHTGTGIYGEVCRYHNVIFTKILWHCQTLQKKVLVIMGFECHTSRLQVQYSNKGPIKKFQAQVVVLVIVNMKHKFCY